jgi:hypothetical protein
MKVDGWIIQKMFIEQISEYSVICSVTKIHPITSIESKWWETFKFDYNQDPDHLSTFRKMPFIPDDGLFKYYFLANYSKKQYSGKSFEKAMSKRQ